MRTVWLILGAQAGVAVAAVLLALAFGGAPRVIWSALIGGAIGCSTAAIYAGSVFAAGDKEPRELVKAHYRAEVFKFAFTVVLFTAAFTLYKDVSTLPLLLTYIATLVVYWVALLFA